MKAKIETPLDDELRPEYDFTVLKNGVRGKYHKAYRAGHSIRIRQLDGSVSEQHYKFVNRAVLPVSEVREDFPEEEK